MKGLNGEKYILSPGTQVREEDFGLLFYTMKGPRLYFMSCGNLLDSQFFQGQCTLAAWLEMKAAGQPLPDVQRQMVKIGGKLHHLCEKGVIREC